MRNNANSSWPVGARKLVLGALATGAFFVAHTLLVSPAQAKPAPKVEICHIPPGNPANWHTITISENALQMHITKHGDFIGRCGEFCEILCDDGNACTVDACAANEECIHTTVDCNDSNVCTADSCDAVTGCEYEALTGDTCTVDDTNPCTEPIGLCDVAGVCEPSPAPDCCLSNAECEAVDEDLCTIENCSENKCETVNEVDCATDACHVSVCTPDTGTCTIVEPIVCPGGECQTTGCDPVAGCFLAPIPGCCIDDPDCDDADNCTTDTCFGIDGCTNDPCAAGDECNILTDCDQDTCAPISEPQVCLDDGDLCTAESCVEGLGCVADPIDCADDGNLCTTSRCDTALGCVSDPVSCDEGTACDPSSGECVPTQCQTPGADVFLLTGRVNDSITLGAGQPNETTITSLEGVDHGGPTRNSAWIAAYDSGRQLQWAASISAGNSSGDGFATISASDSDDAGNVYVTLRASIYPGTLTLTSANGTTVTYAPPLDTQHSSYGVAKINTAGVWQWFAPIEADAGAGDSNYAHPAAISVHGGRAYITAQLGRHQTGGSLRFSDQTGITFPFPDRVVHPMIILDGATGSYIGHRIDGEKNGAGAPVYRTFFDVNEFPTIGAAGPTGWYDGSTGGGRNINVAANFGSPDELQLPAMQRAGLLARRDLNGDLQWAYRVNNNNSATSSLGYSEIGAALETGDGAIFLGGAEGSWAPEFHHAGGVQAMSPFSDPLSQYLVRYTEEGFISWISTIGTGGADVGFTFGKAMNRSALYDPIADRVYVAYAMPAYPTVTRDGRTHVWGNRMLFGEGEPTEEVFNHTFYGPAFPSDGLIVLAAFDGVDGSLLWATSHRRILDLASTSIDALLDQPGPGGLYLDGNGGIVMLLESGPGPVATNYEDEGNALPIVYSDFTVSAVRHSVADGSVLCVSDLEDLATSSGALTDITGSLTVK